MARTEARLLSAIWRDDEDFKRLPATPQRLYMFLFSQGDISLCGVLPLVPSRWVNSASDLTLSGIDRDLDILQTARFIVVDESTAEVLVRSLMRRDGVYRQPNLMKAAARQLSDVISAPIRGVLLDELCRIRASSDIPARSVGTVDWMMAELGGGANPSGIPSPIPSGNPSPNSSGMGSGNPSRGVLARVQAGALGTGVGVVLKPTVSEHSRSFSSSKIFVDQPGIDEPEPQAPAGDRPDVDAVCQHLADRIEANGAKRPTITKGWRTAARLMIDRDGRTVDQITRCIDWCQDNEFWRSNVLSMPTLREKYDRLRLAAKRGGNPSRPSTTDARVADALAAGSRVQAHFDAKELTA